MKVKIAIFVCLVLMSVTGTVFQGLCNDVITVSNGEEFIAAIGSERIIKLEPGEYNLSELPPEKTEHVTWEEIENGYSMVIKDVNDLKIVGKGDKQVRIIVNHIWVTVLTLRNVEHVDLINLELGHVPVADSCFAGVLSIEQSSHILIDNSIFFGCGTEGLTLESVNDLVFKDSVIKECSQGIMGIYNSHDLLFQKSKFYNNDGFFGCDFYDCYDVLFKYCEWENNIAGQDWCEGSCLFRAESCFDMMVDEGTVKNNVFHFLSLPEGTVEFKNTEVENNKAP